MAAERCQTAFFDRIYRIPAEGRRRQASGMTRGWREHTSARVRAKPGHPARVIRLPPFPLHPCHPWLFLPLPGFLPFPVFLLGPQVAPASLLSSLSRQFVHINANIFKDTYDNFGCGLARPPPTGGGSFIWAEQSKAGPHRHCAGIRQPHQGSRPMPYSRIGLCGGVSVKVLTGNEPAIFVWMAMKPFSKFVERRIR